VLFFNGLRLKSPINSVKNTFEYILFYFVSFFDLFKCKIMLMFLVIPKSNNEKKG